MDHLPTLTKVLLKYFHLPHRNLPDSANWYPGLVTRKLCSCFCLWQIQVQLKILQSERDTIKSLECVFMISNGIPNLLQFTNETLWFSYIVFEIPWVPNIFFLWDSLKCFMIPLKCN